MSLRTQMEKMKWRGEKSPSKADSHMEMLTQRQERCTVGCGADEERAGAGCRGTDSNLPNILSRVSLLGS